MILILFVVVGNGALALVGVGGINATLCTWLCRKWPDRRYAKRELKKQGLAKAERKESIKNVKKRLKSKTPFASEEINGARWEEISELFNTDFFRRKDHKQTRKENKIGFAFRYRWRHSWRFMAGLCVSFFIFSYPLFNLYKVTFPWSMVKEHKYEHDIMSWNPRYKIDFTYKGKPGNIAMQFKNSDIAMVRVAIGSAAPYTGFAMLHTEIAQGTVHKPAQNKFLSCQLHKVMFTRLDKDPRLGSKEMDRIEAAVTRVLGNKLNGNVYPMGKREGVVIYSRSLPGPLYYRPLALITPCDFEDLKIWWENGFGSAKRL